jgi:ubiquinone/menaquinone biosynthesis C-methylase UbiE
VLTVDYARLDVQPGMTVLDLGCGEGRHAFEAYRRGAHVVALDHGTDEVATTRRWLDAIAAAGEAPAGARAEVVRGDLRALPFPDAGVDRVIAAEVLEHIPDDRAAFAEIARVLAPGGRVALLSSVNRGLLPAPVTDAVVRGVTGVRIFGRDELTDALAGHGLVEVRQRVAGFAQFVSARRP